MLIAISGAQGSGKSTILRELNRLGYNTVERKTSRYVLNNWDKSLSEIYADPTIHKTFQNELFLLKAADELEAVNSDEAWFTERTYADLFCYTLFNLGNTNEHSDFVDDYYDRCRQNNNQYDKIFYLESGHFNVVSDGVRGCNKHYSRAMDRIMFDATNEMATNVSVVELINTPSIDQRIQTILHFINTTT